MRAINLDRLRDGVGTYSKVKCAFALQAAVICFEKTERDSGVTCRLDGLEHHDSEFTLHWQEQVNDNIRESWNDDFELVEWGAIGIALLMISEFTNFDSIRQAERGKGDDFLLGNMSASDSQQGFADHEKRLEVSGILRATADNTVAKRVKSKLKRFRDFKKLNTPVYIIVAEFSEPMIDWSEEKPFNE